MGFKSEINFPISCFIIDFLSVNSNDSIYTINRRKFI
nr:MAG TPA: hypothetical protein [Caudoviricetes sp.]